MGSRRRTRSLAADRRAETDRWSRSLETICLVLVAALLVVAPLVISDVGPELATDAVPVMLWMVVWALWSLRVAIDRGICWKWDGVDVAVGALVAWHWASAAWLIASESGNVRAAINVSWRWTAFGVAFFLLRQMSESPQVRRVLAAVMLCLAVGLSTVGLFDSWYRMPALSREYQQLASEQARRQWLEQHGLEYYEPGTPERKYLEDRLLERPARATFALENSLAGFLAPWLLLGIWLVQPLWKTGGRQRALLWLGFAVPLIAACLLMTKSRTACAAVGIGLLVVGWHIGRRRGSRPLQFGVVVAATFGVAIPAVAWVAGVGWVREPVKSIAYRLEYWRGAWLMAADNPLFGCGPGNFKSAYTLYKLPESSETVVDPHNFFMEVLATCGWGGAAALAPLVVLCVLRLRRRSQPLDEGAVAERRDAVRSATAVCTGAGLGVAMAFPISWMADCPIPPSVLLGVPTAAAAAVLLGVWVVRGSLHVFALIAALLVWLINLCAAGGIGYAGVAMTGWLLLALALGERNSRTAWDDRWGARGVVVGGGVAGCGRGVPVDAAQAGRGIAALVAHGRQPASRRSRSGSGGEFLAGGTGGSI